jgi:hypothetical protein
MYGGNDGDNAKASCLRAFLNLPFFDRSWVITRFMSVS